MILYTIKSSNTKKRANSKHSYIPVCHIHYHLPHSLITHWGFQNFIKTFYVFQSQNYLKLIIVNAGRSQFRLTFNVFILKLLQNYHNKTLIVNLTKIKQCPIERRGRRSYAFIFKIIFVLKDACTLKTTHHHSLNFEQKLNSHFWLFNVFHLT